MYRIEAIPTGGGQGFLISDGTGARGPGGKICVNDISFAFDAVVPEANYINGPQTVRIPWALRNYNQSGEIPLEVEYEFATEAACLRFWSALQSTCPVLADVRLSAGGAVAVIPNAKLRPLRGITIGQVSVRVMYPLSFGLIVQTGQNLSVPSS